LCSATHVRVGLCSRAVLPDKSLTLGFGALCLELAL
jgi:hypothetical protein